MTKETAQMICRSVVAETNRFPGTLVSASDREVIVTNAINRCLWITLTGFTVEVIRDRGTPHELHLGHLGERQVRSYTLGQWSQWAKFIVSGHCGNIPEDVIIQTLTRLKNEAAEAERFLDAHHYLTQLRELRAKVAPTPQAELGDKRAPR